MFRRQETSEFYFSQNIAQSHVFLSPPIQAMVIFVGVLLSSSTAIADKQFMILNTTQDSMAS